MPQAGLNQWYQYLRANEGSTALVIRALMSDSRLRGLSHLDSSCGAVHFLTSEHCAIFGCCPLCMQVVEDGQTMGMELTSQGAGTYWYLPPECFQTSSSSSMGSSRPGGAAGVSGLLPGGLLSGEFPPGRRLVCRTA